MRLSTLLLLLVLGGTASAADRPNVLFIAVDDLKPALDCYGDPRPQPDRMSH